MDTILCLKKNLTLELLEANSSKSSFRTARSMDLMDYSRSQYVAHEKAYSGI